MMMYTVFFNRALCWIGEAEDEFEALRKFDADVGCDSHAKGLYRIRYSASRHGSLQSGWRRSDGVVRRHRSRSVCQIPASPRQL